MTLQPAPFSYSFWTVQAIQILLNEEDNQDFPLAYCSFIMFNTQD
jgi:hypothetical protein